MSPAKIQKIISVIALLLILVHIVWPHLAIDGITIGLLILAIVPWLSPLFKSIQFPGGVKIEYQDLEKTEKQMKHAGLFPKKHARSTKQFDFLPSPYDDPSIALAWLRIEIEKRFRGLIQEKKLSEEGGLKRNLIVLFQNGILSEEEKNALFDLVEILSSAMHGVIVDPSAAEWAVEVGPLVLRGLDNKIKQK